MRVLLAAAVLGSSCRAPSGGGSDGGGSGGPGRSWWVPAQQTTWQWQLAGAIDTTADAGVYDIGLFDNPQSVIDTLHAQGRKVICYFDTAYEPSRSDSAKLEPYRGNAVQGWPGQFWLDTRQPAVRDVMAARVTLARSKGCDALEPDDVDVMNYDPGFPITAQDQLDFCRFLSGHAHDAGMGVALKNDLYQVPQLVADFDFAINDECFHYAACAALQPFTAAGKAVLQAEYEAGTPAELASKGATICPQSNPLHFSTIIKHRELDAPTYSCR